MSGGFAISLLEQAVSHRQHGRLQASETICRKIIGKNPDSQQALQLLGALLLETGRAREAEEVLRRCAAANETSAEVLHNLALSCAAQGEIHEATHLFARAIVLRADYTSAYYNLALALQSSNEPDKAAAVYERVVAMEPNHAEAWNNLGILHHAKGELKEAAEQYRRAIAANPKVESAGANLASALRSLGDREGAKTAFDEVLARNPRDPLANYVLAQIDYRALDVTHSMEKLVMALDEIIEKPHWLNQVAPGTRHVPHYDMARYRHAFEVITERLAAAKIEFSLLCGTLLGAIRGGDFMNHDKDMDFGIEASVTPAMLDAALSVDSRFRRITDLSEDNILPAYRFEGYAAIDFFRLYREDNALWYGLKWQGHLVQWRHQPFGFRDFTFLGIPAKIPDDGERYLRECYGENWRVPDPYFGTWGSPNIVGGFPPICRCIAYANIFKASWSGDRPRALRYCEQALELDPDDKRVAALYDVLRLHSSRLVAPQRSVLETLDDPFDNLA
jgi:tetratricopeptide (TPR) repeat protein